MELEITSRELLVILQFLENWSHVSVMLIACECFWIPMGYWLRGQVRAEGEEGAEIGTLNVFQRPMWFRLWSTIKRWWHV